MGSIIGGAGGMASGAGSLAGGIGGMIASKGDQSKARDLVNQAIEAMQGVQLPSDLANALNLQQYQRAGTLTPEQEQTINAAPSQAGQVKGNANLQNAQMQALNALHGLSQTGMTSADKARLNQIQQQQATQAEGQRQAVLQNFAQRGLGGSGNELMAQLMASQNAANQANQQGLNVAAQAQQNALQALSQYGNQAGQMEGQQFGQQQQSAQANDLLNRFNVQNQMQQQARNVSGQNQAQAANLQNQQNIMNANTGMANQEMLRQKQAEEQMFQNAMQKAGGVANVDMSGSGQYGNMAKQTAQQWQNIGSGMGNMMGGALQNSKANNEDDSAAALAAFAHGGEVPCYSFGGHVPKSEDAYVRTYGNGFDAPNNYASGGEIMKVLPLIAALAARGGKVPGKAKVSGDSYKNDTVDAKLSPGEFVVPRSVMQSKNPPENAKQMINDHLKDNKEDEC